MRAAVYTSFAGPVRVKDVTEPVCHPDGAVIRVGATGVCRSDWWGWQGNDPDINLPHVPGHEFAGTIVETGSKVIKWKAGDRVTVPFVSGCGKCPYCKNGNQQVCDDQFQPGFTAWGSFAEYVSIRYADENIVRLPGSMSFVEAASLGCRFITSFRAIMHQAMVREGEWLSVFGCGGVGLSAVLIAKAAGARVIAVDVLNEKLDFAARLGADDTINSRTVSPEARIMEITQGGCHVSIDALGLQETCIQSIRSLRKQGRHVQVGLMEGSFPTVPLPMNLITGNEIEIYGSHGMQAHKYAEIFSMIDKGKLDPAILVTAVIGLEEGVDILMKMDTDPPMGIAVIDLEKSGV